MPAQLLQAMQGPYRILDTCHAKRHNSTSAYHLAIRCKCPGTLILRNAYNRAHPQLLLGTRRSRAKPVLTEEIISIPDLTGGLCTTPKGQKIAQGGFNTSDWPSGVAARDNAVALCLKCPRRSDCGAWVDSQEKPAGKWQGVYAGYTQQERESIPLTMRSYQ